MKGPLIWIVVFVIGLIFVEGSRQDDLSKFTKWYFTMLDQEGIKQPKLFIGIPEGETEAGIYATADVQDNEDLLRVPYNLMITSDRIMETTFSELKDVFTEIQLTDSDIISLYLAFLKRCKPEINPWELWIDVLPKKANNIWYFTDNEIKALEGTRMGARATANREAAIDTFDRIKTNLIEKDKLCSDLVYDDFKWGKAMVSSRSVNLKGDKGSFLAIIPFFDFFNHDNPPTDKWSWGYKADNQFFHCEAVEAAKKGQEVYQVYGHLSNDQLLENYGFLIEDNRYDAVEVEPEILGVNPEDPLYDIKAPLIEAIQQNPSKLYFMRGSMSKELRNAAYIIAGSEQDFEDGELVKGQKSIINEYFSADFFQAVVRHKLSQYPTTLDDDEKLMKTSLFSAMSLRMKQAIVTRVMEKSALAEIGTAFAELQMKIREVVKEQEKLTKEEL